MAKNTGSPVRTGIFRVLPGPDRKPGINNFKDRRPDLNPPVRSGSVHSGPVQVQIQVWTDLCTPLLTFGNMTLELNIFHLNSKHKLVENENQGTDEVCSFDQNAGKPNVHKFQELANQDEAVDWELPSGTTVEKLVSPKAPS